MNATLTRSGALALLTCLDDTAVIWLKRQPETSTLRRHDVGGKFAVSGNARTIEVLSRRMCGDAGLNVEILPEAA